MIQDIFPHRFSNHFQPNVKMDENDFVLHYRGNSVLLKANCDEFSLPRKSDFTEPGNKLEAIFLFTLNDISCFLVWDELKTAGSCLNYHDISFFRSTQQREIAWVCIAGYQLMNWYLQNKFCGKCGAPTQHKPDERALNCTVCQTTFYPKISPAIIVAIICNDKILLARNTQFSGNWYSLIAGYADVGETLEETVAREVKEEVGLEVTNIRYYKSQPWPLSGSVMIGFTAEADDNQPVVADKVEIAEAAWFSRGNLPPHSSSISIAGEMIEKFEKGEL